MPVKLDAKTLRRLGGLIIRRIVLRTTEEGLDAKGRPFKPYSTRTFAMPAGATTKRALVVLEKSGALSYFTTKAGNLWVLIEGGYAALKSAEFAKAGGAGGVNLSRTGSMLRSLTVTGIDEGRGIVSIGFARVDAAERAYYVIEQGRDFLGIREEEIAADPEMLSIITNGISIDL